MRVRISSGPLFDFAQRRRRTLSEPFNRFRASRRASSSVFIRCATLRVNLCFMSWYVYIAKAETGRYYTGITNSPSTRILKHNKGEGSRFAQQQGPFFLVYTSSPFPSKSDARKREIQIKGWIRDKKEKLIKGEWV